MALSIVNGSVLTPEGLSDLDLHIQDQVIAESSVNGRTIEADGCYVLPGIIDIHGDGFERIIQPRSGVSFPIDLALREADRQLIANGITTAYHGLTVSWEPGLRSIDQARLFRTALAQSRDTFLCDMKLHVRWETFALGAAEEVASWFDAEQERIAATGGGPTGMILAFNDHATEVGKTNGTTAEAKKVAGRTGLSEPEFVALFESIWARRDEVKPTIEAMAKRVLATDSILLAHDETSVEQRQWFRALGALASEFPLNGPTAKEARDAGEHTILGAPNVVRGGSHTGAMSAREAVAEGLCTVLASDYYYPAQLHAAFKLVEEGVCQFAQAWDLISKNPAEVGGLTDRGVLAPGKRADVIVVDARDPASPTVRAVVKDGKLVSTLGVAVH